MARKLALLSAVAALGIVATPALATKMTKPAPAKTAKVNKLSAEFQAYAGKDGAITKAQLVKPGMSKATSARIASLFKTADRNHDGKITSGEFTTSVAARLNSLERHS